VREYRTFVFHWLYVSVLTALKHLKIVTIVAGDPTPNPHPGAILSEVLNLEPELFSFSMPVETGDEMAVTTVRDVFVIWVPSLGAETVVTALPFMTVWQ
jgi:hypothetical protein